MNPSRRVLVPSRLPYLRSGNADLDRWVEQHLQSFVGQTFEQFKWIVGSQQEWAFKTAATARDSTTTLTADPDLAIRLDAMSVYQIELQVLFKGETGTSGNQGFNFAMGYSGTLAVEGRALGHKIVNLTPTVHAGATGAFSMSSGPIPGGVAPIAVGVQDMDSFYATWLVETSTAGTMSVNWAQASSSADDTSLLQGSYLISKRLSQ